MCFSLMQGFIKPLIHYPSGGWIILRSKENEKLKISIIVVKVWEAYQIGHGKAFKFHGTLCISFYVAFTYAACTVIKKLF